MTSHLIDGGRHRLAKGDPLSRESLAFMLQLPEAGVAAAIYTWVNGAGLGGSSDRGSTRRVTECLTRLKQLTTVG